MSRPYTELRFEGTPDEINAQWVEARKNGIGGSDVASIMGINKYSSPLEVWLQKTGRAEAPDLSGKEAVEWGNRLEDCVAQKFAEQHPELKVTRRNAMLVSKERPWAFANIDRQLSDGGELGILECKTVGMRRAADWDAGVPDYYLTQVTHYLSVTGWSYAWVAVLIGGQEYREYRLERDEGDVRAVEEAVDGFWKGFVETDAMPQAMGCPTESRALTDYYGAPSEELTPMLDEDVPGLDELAEIKAEMDALKRRKDAIENNLREIIGMTRGIETEARRVTWVRSVRTSYDYDALDAEHPGLRDQYRKTSITNGGIRVAERK